MCTGRMPGVRLMQPGKLLGSIVRTQSSVDRLTLTGSQDRPIVVPLEEAEKTGLRRDQVRVEDLHGGGFVANVEGLHHLHCLVSEQ